MLYDNKYIKYNILDHGKAQPNTLKNLSLYYLKKKRNIINRLITLMICILNRKDIRIILNILKLEKKIFIYSITLLKI